eukprot:1146263-Pelagomonas_calceolata.AAC.5
MRQSCDKGAIASEENAVLAPQRKDRWMVEARGSETSKMHQKRTEGCGCTTRKIQRYIRSALKAVVALRGRYRDTSGVH